jgi:hypothetical protein
MQSGQRRMGPHMIRVGGDPALTVVQKQFLLLFLALTLVM